MQKLEEALKEGYALTGHVLNNYKDELNKLKPFEQFCRIVPYLNQEQNYIMLYLEYKGVLIRPYFDKTGFIFFLKDNKRLREFKYNLKEPNKVGVPTVKKLDAWLNYLTSIEALKVAQIKNNEEVKDSFINKLKETGLQFQGTETNGYMYINGFKYSFEIENGKVHQRLVYQGSQTIEDLLKFIK